MPRGGRLTIHTRWSANWTSRTESGLRITIADTGEGMALEVKRRNLRAVLYYQGVGAGTGPGMWVAQIVDRLHGSYLRLELDRSSTAFSVYLPFDRSPDGVSVLRGEPQPVTEPMPETVP